MADEFDAELERARTYLELDRLDRARETVVKVLAAEPNHNYALYLLGHVEYRADNDGKAVEILARVVASQPNWTPGLRLYARALDAVRRHRQAVKIAERAVAEDPDDSNNLLLLAELNRFWHPRRALKLVEQVQRMEPENVSALRVRALVCRRLFRFGEARDCLRRAVAEDPNDSAALYHYATNQAEGMRFPTAIRGIFMGAEQRPGAGDVARANLAFVIFRMLVPVQVALLITAIVMLASVEQVPGASNSEPLATWGRVVGAVMLGLIALAVVAMARAVPQGRWPAMWTVCKQSLKFPLSTTIIGVLGIAGAAATGVQTHIALLVLLLFGSSVSGVASLIRWR